jgi:hypothetical protein
MVVNNSLSPDNGTLVIPAIIRIGVTGHRELSDEQLIRDSVIKTLTKLDDLLIHIPHTFTIISSLAEGADRLVAKEVLGWEVSKDVDKPTLKVVLPLHEDDYILDFTESQNEFFDLLEEAESVKTLAKTDTRNGAYEQVGRFVVENCDVLIAIWDGKPAAGQGGTAEIVKYANDIGRSVFLINSIDGNLTIDQLDEHTLEFIKKLAIYNNEHLSEKKIESAIKFQYNALIERNKNLDIEPFLKLLKNTFIPHYVRADLLALHYQRCHIKAGNAIYTLAAMAVATITLQTLFLPHHPEFLWLEAIEIGTILFLLFFSHKGEWHRKWIDYRFLAERLRSGLFLCIANINCEPPRAPPHLSLSHKPDDWMVRAYMYVWGKKPKLQPESQFDDLKKFLLEAWINDQISYYKKASARHRRNHTIYSSVGGILFLITFIAVIMHTLEIGESWHYAIPKILASIAIIFPAIGASLAGIRVHQEYLKNAERYRHMGQHLSSIRKKIEDAKDMKILTAILEVVNEMMLRENQDWRVVLLFQKLEAP